MKKTVTKNFINFLYISIFLYLCLFSSSLNAYTANKVWMEFRNNGQYRVFVEYTVIEIKEIRQAYIDFKTKKEAEDFYFNLLKGADFYLSDSTIKFSSSTEDEPW